MDYHFTVKGHPVGFIIEATSKDDAIQQFKEHSTDGISGIQGFTVDDIESIEEINA